MTTIVVVAFVAVAAQLVALKSLAYSTSIIDEIDDADAAPARESATRLGPLTWDAHAYETAPSLEPFRAFFHETCASKKGIDAATCVARAFAAKSPFGTPRHEFVDASYDPAATFASHLAGAPGHCVSRSSMTATTLLSAGIPARVVQLVNAGTGEGHNVLEVWDETNGWVEIDPSYGYVLLVGGRPGSATKGRQSGGVAWATFDQTGMEHVADEIQRGAIVLPDPWLYTRVGRSAAPWPFRGAFVRIGNEGAWALGRSQATLRYGIVAPFLFAIASVAWALLEPLARRRLAREPTAVVTEEAAPTVAD